MLRSFDWAQDSARTGGLASFQTVHPELVEACPELVEGGGADFFCLHFK
jgi:hypothetical protein